MSDPIQTPPSQDAEKQPAPLFPQMESNPGQGTALKLTLTKDNGNESFEHVVLAEILQNVLAEAGWTTEIIDGGWLYQPDTGYYLWPLIWDLSIDEDDGSVQTASTIQIHHHELFPNGIFEYQYSFGQYDTVHEALASGFDTWLKTDWETLLDAADPQEAAHLRLTITPKGDVPKRLVLLGSVGFFPAREDDGDEAEAEECSLHGEFCECCLFTRSMEAFEPLIKSQENYAIRIFASRDDEGETDADCRVNGEDWDGALESLKNYAATWQGSGMMFRKQYIIIRNAPDDWPEEAEE